MGKKPGLFARLDNCEECVDTLAEKAEHLQLLCMTYDSKIDELNAKVARYRDAIVFTMFVMLVMFVMLAYGSVSLIWHHIPLWRLSI